MTQHDISLPAIQETSLPADSPATMLRAAIDRGITAEGIKALAEVFERMQDKNAEREFNIALLDFQTECPTILKESDVSFPTRSGGQMSFKYAKLDQVVKTIRPLLQKHGFSFSFDTALANKQVTSFCILRHISGHSTRTPFIAPVDPAPKISEAHATASAVSFAQRYALQLALGLVTGLSDDDGKGGFTEGDKITDDQRHTLEVLLEEAKADTDKFWQYAGVAKGRLADLPARDYAKVQQALLQAKARGGKK